MANEQLHKFLEGIGAALKESAPTGERRAGEVTESMDGIMRVAGLSDLKLGEVVAVPEAEAEAMVMRVEPDAAFAVALRNADRIRTGHTIEPTGRILSVPAGEGLLGRVIDPFGAPLDAGSEIKGEWMPLEANAPSVMDRKSVHEPLQTGIVSIDALIPIGRGQRELIIGDRQTGKTTVALDTIINQKGKDVVCIYVGIGQRESKMAQVVRTLQENGAMAHTIVVNAGASVTPMMRYLAPYAGAAIGEWFMKNGKHALVVYDDLSKHAVAYREVSLLLRKPPGREAYPGDVFYAHSRLLERAAKIHDGLGGGSVTALPIIETQAGDVSAYIPTNVISITDGQIFLETSLFHQGVRPAINVGISVSRVGGSAQTSIMKKVAGSVKLDLAQYYELAAFSQFASELDPATKKRLVRGKRLVESLKQGQNKPYELWQEIVVLWAASHGHLDAVEESEVQARMKDVVNTVEYRHPDLVADIQKNMKLTDEVKTQLEAAIAACFANTEEESSSAEATEDKKEAATA